MKKIIINGTFDIVHRGHINLLNFAKSLGDYLLVCVDSDSRVSSLKGPDRPINRLSDRMLLLENLRSVDEVKSFDSDSGLENLIKEYQPDIMVKGSDYQNKSIIGQQFCKAIVFMDLHHGYSTTNIVQRIIDRR